MSYCLPWSIVYITYKSLVECKCRCTNAACMLFTVKVFVLLYLLVCIMEVKNAPYLWSMVMWHVLMVCKDAPYLL